jgi:hypothetical protein
MSLSCDNPVNLFPGFSDGFGFAGSEVADVFGQLNEKHGDRQG